MTDLLERAVVFTLGCLRAVPAAALAARTPCAGWDLGALLTHLDDSLLALHEAAELGHVYPEPVGTAADPLVAARDHAERLLDACTARRTRRTTTVVDRELPTGVLTSVGAVEVAVHGWDVAASLGLDRPIPAGLAEELLAFSPFLVAADDRPVRFAPPIPLPRGAPPGDRLVAFLGRRP